MPHKIMCDRCGLEATEHDNEFSEFISIEHSCGYDSTTFGDLTHVKVDLCQRCAFELLHPFIGLREHGYEGREATREKAMPYIQAYLKRNEE